MKLQELLTENDEGFTVYEVTSPNTDKTYYGYTQGKDVQRAFQVGAARENDPDRGDVRMSQAAGGDIRVKVLDWSKDEIGAFMERNDYRAKDPNSITGPTNFPASMYQRARQIDPERVKSWKLAGDINATSAREAMGDQYKGVSGYSYNNVKDFVAQNPQRRKEVMHDLDNMLYPEFKQKYFP